MNSRISKGIPCKSYVMTVALILNSLLRSDSATWSVASISKFVQVEIRIPMSVNQKLDIVFVIYSDFMRMVSDVHHVVKFSNIPDSKVHGANMRPTWVLSAPDGPHVGPMNLAIRDMLLKMIYHLPQLVLWSDIRCSRGSRSKFLLL